MIRQFRNLSPLNLFLLAAFAVLIRLGYFGRLPDTLFLDFEEPFARFLVPVELSNALSPLANVSIALVLVFIQSLIFNRVINRHNLVGKSTYLPALMFLTTSALLTNFLFLSPALVCNFLLIWMMDKFLDVYRQDEARSVMFDLGMLIALGSLFYFPFIAFLPLLWISLLIFRPWNWREWVAGLMGFITIYFFLAVYYYWYDQLEDFPYIFSPLVKQFPTRISINILDYLVLIPALMVLILAVIQLRQTFFRSFVQVRKAYQFLLFMLLLAMASYYLKAHFSTYHFILCIPALSVFMAYYFFNATKKWVYETLYFLLLAMIVYSQLN